MYCFEGDHSAYFYFIDVFLFFNHCSLSTFCTRSQIRKASHWERKDREGSMAIHRSTNPVF